MLETIADGLVQWLPGLDPSARLARSIRFFVEEILVIGSLLLAVTHVMGLVNALFPVERVRDAIASGRLRGLEHLTASAFGAVTPFCSCSSIPLFIGFLQGGIPLGVGFSFLITSPLVNEVALAVFLGAFGWKVTALYAGAGVLLGTVLGPVLGRMGLDRHLEDWVREAAAASGPAGAEAGGSAGWSDVLRDVSSDALAISANVAPYVVVGVAGCSSSGWAPATRWPSRPP